MNKDDLSKIFQILKKATPEPVTELIYKTNFQLLIAVILSAQATDKSVNAATKSLFKIAPDAKSIYNLGEKKLKEYIKTIGLYNAKAKNVIKTCKILLDEYNNKIPQDRDTLKHKVTYSLGNFVFDNRVLVQKICTDGLNLFRILIGYLKPILPNISLKVEDILICEPISWANLDQLLLNKKVNKFKPIIKRIDDEDIKSMKNFNKGEK